MHSSALPVVHRAGQSTVASPGNGRHQENLQQEPRQGREDPVGILAHQVFSDSVSVSSSACVSLTLHLQFISAGSLFPQLEPETQGHGPGVSSTKASCLEEQERRFWTGARAAACE